MTTDALKKQAREHEQNEAWEKALSVYRRALEQSESGGEPEIGLYNRVADLELRLGNVESALEQYERAIELYLESDLPNNAIAICRKILRNVPGRPETFLRIGQIRARQGFAVEARQNVLTYAEMMESGGQTEAATAALEEFVRHFPEDVQTRIFRGERLVGLEQPGPGVDHLIGAWRELGRSGVAEQDADRAALQARILTLDPEADFASGPEVVPGRGRGAGSLPGLESSAGFVLDAPEADGDPSGLDVTFSEIGSLEGDSPEDAEAGAGAAPPPAAGDPGGRSGSMADAGPADFSLDDLPTAGDATPAFGGNLSGFLDPADGGVERFLHGGGFGLSEEEAEESGDEDGSEDAEAMDASWRDALLAGGDEAGRVDDGPAMAGFDVPPGDDAAFGVEEADEAEAGTPAFGEIDTLAETPGTPDTRADGFELLDETVGDETHDEETQDETAPLPGFEASPASIAELEAALSVDPARVDHWRALVDQAHEAGDRPLLIRALAGLAGAFETEGDGERALATWAQVRQLDPRHAGLAASSPPPEVPASPPSPKPVEPLDEFVNLGALVLDDEEAPTTRWVVQDEQSGDEDADFAHMLSKFKAKVAQHITRDDARSSYDLGTAYREMGLLDEAIGMFQQALRAQPAHLASLEMLGQCFLDRNEPQVAIRVLERALDAASPVEDDLVGIYYFLGVSHDQAGNRDEAREFYEKVFSLDINFKDVTERLRALR